MADVREPEDRTVPTRHQDVAILIPSCDAYQGAWKPFFHCFFKFWPDCPYEVFLGSNHLSFPDPRVSPILVGPDVDYSSNLMMMLDHIEQDWVIISNEDLFLSAPVNTARVHRLINLVQRKQIVFLLLYVDPYSVVRVDDEMDGIGEIANGAPYRVSMSLALWQKRVLLKLLRPGETAWDIEYKGTRRSYELEHKFYALSACTQKNPPLSTVHGLRKRKWTVEATKFLQQEGLHDYLRALPQQTSWSCVYERVYAKARYVVFGLLSRLR